MKSIRKLNINVESYLFLNSQNNNPLVIALATMDVFLFDIEIFIKKKT